MPKTDWITDVRSVLRREHGKGWLIEQQSGRIKICLAVPGQRRQTITTHLSWAHSSATKLTNLVIVIRDGMESLKLGLSESYRLLVDVPESAVQDSWIGLRSPSATSNGVLELVTLFKPLTTETSTPTSTTL